MLNSNNLLQQVVAQCGLEKLERSGGWVARERLPVAIEKLRLDVAGSNGVAESCPPTKVGSGSTTAASSGTC